MIRSSLLLLFEATWTLLSAPAAAQVPQGSDAAYAASAEAIARHVGVMAADSMRSRDTPSRELDLAAQYVAGQFARLGLAPGGDSGGWIQRYPIPLPLDFSRSQVAFTVGEKTVSAGFTAAARLFTPTVPGAAVIASPVVVTGRHTVQSLAQANVHDKVVLYVPPAGLAPEEQHEVVESLGAANRGVIVLSAVDSAAFADRLQGALRRAVLEPHRPWGVEVRPEAATGLGDMLLAAGLDLAHARRDTVPAVRELPALRVAFEPQLEQAELGAMTAPNVVGVLEGTDTELKNQYIVVSAHMDRTGAGGPPDDVSGGVHDNASGVAGMLEVARLLSQPGARPRRSIVFLASSGGARGLWGSTVFAQRMVVTALMAKQARQAAEELRQMMGLPVQVSMPGLGNIADSLPVGDLVADINLDMIGRPRRDSVLVDGLQDVELVTRFDWIAAAHPELRLAVVDGGTVVRPTSDHFAFVQSGIPSLYIHSDTQATPPREPDAPAAVDAEYVARIARLVSDVGQEVANGVPRPRWTPEGRRRYLRSVGR